MEKVLISDTSKNHSSIPSVQHFCIDTPLYSEHDISGCTNHEILWFEYFQYTIDSTAKSCTLTNNN